MSERNPLTRRSLQRCLATMVLAMSIGSPAAAQVPYAYITNSNGNSVTVVDTNANEIVGTPIPVGHGPAGVAVSPDGTRVFVSNESDNTVSVIDTATNTVLGSPIPVGNRPCGIAFGAAGTRAFVANCGGGTVTIIDVATRAVVKTTAVIASNAIGAAANPAGSRIYVTDNIHGTITEINALTNTVIRTSGRNFGWSNGLVVNSAGTRLYVADSSSPSTVRVVNISNWANVATIPVDPNPTCVALHPDGSRVYVSSYGYNGGGSTVAVIDTTTNTVVTKVTVGNTPEGVAVNPSGTRLYVANVNGNSVSVVDLASLSVIKTITGFSRPIAYGPFIQPSQKQTPIITWTPAPLSDGSGLGPDQLNATASIGGSPVSGTFTYTPGAGTVLPVGTHTLSATFVPADTSSYWATTATASLTVTPIVFAEPRILSFAGTNANGVLGPLTPPQPVAVSFSAPTSMPWTATADQPWVQVTSAAADGSGMGPGTFSVGIINPGNVLAGVTQATARVTITAPAAAQPTRTVTINLSLRPSGTGASPFGLVDTPLQQATNVVGTIGVTGWVLDDVGVASVQVYRDCLPFEPSVNCSAVAGRAVVFVGDATLVDGARPDIELLYPAYPHATRAAWGYLLLTNMLPHVPSQQMFGGQGQMNLRVLATDLEGQQTWLGRAQHDTTPTTITLANDTIAVPFGAIDTPAQGATVSGTIANFGWALTPDSNATGGEPGDIIVPANGSTLRVYIDGVPGATIAYNQCRGTTASGPVPAGVFCDDDVASIFGQASPQAPFTPRAANPTPHRNLDAGRGAIGALLIDTSTLSNGVHTIMWGVTDSAGRGEGLGSRYFRVLNASTDGSAAEGLKAQGAEPGEDRPQAHSSRPSARPEEPTVTSQPANLPGAAASDTGPVRVRTGLDVAAAWVALEPDADGVRHVRIPEIGRVELGLGGGVESAQLVVNGESRPLPPGTHLDAATGRFTWSPGVGYLGTYRLAFVRNGETVVMDVTIGPR